MSDALQDVTLLFPLGKSVTLKGKTITVKPFGFGKYPRILKLLKGLNVGEDAPANAGEAMKKIQGNAKADIMALIADNSDAVVELCALAVDQQKAYFDDLPPDEAIELVQAIIEVNADFFIKRLQPKLLGALSGLTASVGGLLSQDSSPPATA